MTLKHNSVISTAKETEDESLNTATSQRSPLGALVSSPFSPRGRSTCRAQKGRTLHRARSWRRGSGTQGRGSREPRSRPVGPWRILAEGGPRTEVVGSWEGASERQCSGVLRLTGCAHDETGRGAARGGGRLRLPAGAAEAARRGAHRRGGRAPGGPEPRDLERARAGLRGAPGPRRADTLLRVRASGRVVDRAAALPSGHGLPRRVGAAGGGRDAAPPAAGLPLRVRRAARHRARLRPQPHRRGRGGGRAGREGGPGEPPRAASAGEGEVGPGLGTSFGRLGRAGAGDRSTRRFPCASAPQGPGLAFATRLNP